MGMQIHLDRFNAFRKKTENRINEEPGSLGDDGWGLVNFVNIFVDARYTLIFKRPRE